MIEVREIEMDRTLTVTKDSVIATRVYHVGYAGTKDEAESASGIPKIGEPYPAKQVVLFAGKPHAVEVVADGCIWRVTVPYMERR